MIPSPERAAVAWAKTDPDLTAIINGRAATRLPAEPMFPFLRVRLSGGAPTGSDGPVWNPLVSFDCYTDDPATADTFYRTVITRLEALTHHTAHGVFTARVLAARPSPEPDTGWDRYTVDALFVLKP